MHKIYDYFDTNNIIFWSKDKVRGKLYMKTFTSKQVLILVFCIVAGIAFVETSAPMWSFNFLREFMLKLLGYGIVSEFIVVVLAQFY